MININLIAERRAKRLREMNIIRWSSIGVFMVLVGMIGLNIFSMLTLVVERNTESTQRQKYETKAIAGKEYDDTQSKIDLIKPHINLIRQVRVSEAAWMVILADISKNTPPEVVINNITVASSDKGVEVKMGGTAKDEKTVGEYMVSLSKTSWAANEKTKVGTIGITPGPQNTVEMVSFDVSVPVMGMVGGEL
ncbi:MAG: PilN domain-containing protein [bacterium]